MKVVTWSEAKSSGLKHYFTGKPCKRGHIALRQTSALRCMECAKEKQAESMKDPEKRAKQIEEGAAPNVKVLPGQSAIEVAEEELRQRKIPFIIKRPIGNKFEYWKPADMEVIMD